MPSLGPLSIDWPVAGAKIPVVAFAAPAGLPPVGSHIGQTPWPAFPDGSNRTIQSSSPRQELPKSPRPRASGKPRRASKMPGTPQPDTKEAVRT
eukprot:1466006-Pyramimonas_sp.AAC.1